MYLYKDKHLLKREWCLRHRFFFLYIYIFYSLGFLKSPFYILTNYLMTVWKLNEMGCPEMYIQRIITWTCCSPWHYSTLQWASARHFTRWLSLIHSVVQLNSNVPGLEYVHLFAISSPYIRYFKGLSVLCSNPFALPASGQSSAI